MTQGSLRSHFPSAIRRTFFAPFMKNMELFSDYKAGYDIASASYKSGTSIQISI